MIHTTTNPKKSLHSLIFRKLSLKKIIGVSVLALGLTIGTASIIPIFVQASDHDDGEVDTKGRNLNLTDLYVFREQDQNPSASADDLIFVMNTNPRSLARQQYYFSTNALYEFKISRAANQEATPTGAEDVILRFQFGQPNDKGEQEFKLTAIADGKKIDVAKGQTTPLSANQPTINNLSLNGTPVSIFAGLREDPFFFDVEQFFRVRAGALGIGPAVGFRPDNQAIDFAKGYNVNTIVVRVPRSLLQGHTKTTTFDVWETISVKNPRNGNFQQVERLARPAVNEGLVVTNDFLNAFNSIPPTADLSDGAAPVVAEAKKTLIALGNDDKRANALLGAFLPDVMRIDTTQPSGYGKALNTKGSPITGRLLKDDVIDTTLSVLTNGAIAGDNVSYEGTPGNPSQGHKPLEPQFPYLALPN
ncbi:DUF4331 domain-containing protein [Aetokthonos hydrillicola Thurmond2011]|jgi:hypothetical protein|uniref:DUF4331 domain-containing protein n=1 Tax=Aetokthonos hydrillicola Thurmond2011 TaxID=2712845 RepID=A0AAP5MCM3_9CYAN|nr:DUF4331 domain-containing protein [Aetokthonos hydrillicola]MBO3457977.1 DUF4331 domain-containing protein [Aetokthonos hydrillicola CCALA 1050]MBW4591315.1 DUF4331 domain-containing protein [Aetokthonos hydrillicola CCALA 1050]MDR9899357.1 DUF4331 domain-containing protein [Aetokthonos hydrillicola Thurmond2011]